MLLIRTLLGLTADVPRGCVEIDPILPPEALPLHVDGLNLAGGSLSFSVAEEGTVHLREAPPSVRVFVRERGRRLVRAA